MAVLGVDLYSYFKYIARHARGLVEASYLRRQIAPCA